jgi:hypothetical protein
MNTDPYYDLKRATLSIGLTCIMGWTFSYLAIYFFQDYVFGLFVWLPVVMGIVSTVTFGYKHPVSTRALRNNSMLALLFYCMGMLLLAFEGTICLVMAAPIGLLFNWAGYRLGRMTLTNQKLGTPPLTTLLFALSVPAFMAFEDNVAYRDIVRSVTTSVEIAATPEKVWENVVVFPQLAEPQELLFKAGIAYPINAKIQGQGVGAVRYCNFSTGSFVEPITRWDEPMLLQFDVVDQPEPMTELSPYDIHPNHLHGYWVSQKGQFQLTRLENGHTRLEGTTWYVNKIKPDFYWTLWSDYIVHKIHERVLNHIKRESER